MKRPAKDSASVAVGYVRVSTAEQADGGVSLDAQEDRIRAYCRLAGLQLLRIVREEGVSASISFAKRPKGQEVGQLLRDRQAAHVVALKLDRVFRNTEDALQQTRLWDKAGIALHLVDMGGQTLNTATAMGKIFLTMTAAFAELERNLTAERTKLALSHKKAKGERVGNVAFGYRLSGRRSPDGKELLEQDPDEQKVLRRMRDLRNAGYSLREIAAKLNHQGFKTRRGSPWRFEYVDDLLKNAA